MTWPVKGTILGDLTGPQVVSISRSFFKNVSAGSIFFFRPNILICTKRLSDEKTENNHTSFFPHLGRWQNITCNWSTIIVILHVYASTSAYVTSLHFTWHASCSCHNKNFFFTFKQHATWGERYLCRFKTGSWKKFCLNILPNSYRFHFWPIIIVVRGSL